MASMASVHTKLSCQLCVKRAGNKGKRGGEGMGEKERE